MKSNNMLVTERDICEYFIAVYSQSPAVMQSDNTGNIWDKKVLAAAYTDAIPRKLMSVVLKY